MPAISLPGQRYWDTQLIQKYDLTGPRYTSYPTALKFDERYGETNWKNISRYQESKPAPISLYLHIPFCDTICYYCGCNKIVTANRVHAQRYLEYLTKEIQLKAAEIPPKSKVDLIHFGGGTPTYLTDDQIKELIDNLKAKFDFVERGLELAIEVHPQTVTKARLHALRELGFNRISIGVQDFSAEVQKAVNRYNSKEEVQNLVNEARSIGFASVSIDLMYGLPLQTAQSFAETLSDVIQLSPDRLSIFNYAHMPHLFKSQKQINESDLPPASAKLEMLHNSINTLSLQGYEYIGMDHFAKRNDKLHKAQQNGKLHRNFQGYSTHNHSVLHAFGVSAISTIHHHYSQNVKRLDDYYQLLDEDKLPIEKGYILNKDDTMRRYVINTLLCHFQINFEYFRRQFGVAFFDYFSDIQADLVHLEKDKLISVNDEGLTILMKGRILARSVCKLFDAYSNKESALSTRFSRII